MKNIRFVSENYQFLMVKFSIHLNRRVFVMCNVFISFIICSFGCVLPRIVISEEPKYPLRPSEHKPVWMITKCHSEINYTNPIDNERCATVGPPGSFDTFVPVSYFNVTYRNKYCAYCNGVRLTKELKAWNIQINCDSSISITDDNFYSTMEQKNCSIYFLKPDNELIQLCFAEYQYSISSCNETGLWPSYDEFTDLGCRSFIDPFNRTYQNYFCYLCNTDKPTPSEKWFCKHSVPPILDVTPPFIAIINLDAIKSDENDAMDCNIINQFQDKKMV